MAAEVQAEKGTERIVDVVLWQSKIGSIDSIVPVKNASVN